MSASLLKRILDMTRDMGAAETRIAEYAASHPDEVMHMSMAALSRACGVSDPTIMRFCRRLGFDGYQEFKINLAQTLVPAAPFEYEQITATDSVENVVRKTCRNSLNAIQRAQVDLVPAQIAEAGEVLARATWTGIYATGISEVTGLDAEHKFQRLAMRCAAVIGRKKQWMQAEQSRPGEVVLIFSQSGATRQMVEVASAARAGGARVVSVTAEDSPLASQTDVLIAVRPYEHTELMTPLASRLNHHLVVNMMVTVIAKAMGSQFPDQLPALDSWKTDKI
ncbi:RpiR family transcriptional regulator [Palleronia aestuarii]|uniref:RpiR family transcriptional regulator n=1 Tax=Palleronia aestuarii TaxID=568105 RepID=A0A2W7MSL5_9RHOB|nr:MurR/RpiR family transcriptional regulator [Palleronia aestuarii]PZX10533.1 RpiR family transcriptional regulator [Palleronia aestuarii]